MLISPQLDGLLGHGVKSVKGGNAELYIPLSHAEQAKSAELRRQLGSATLLGRIHRVDLAHAHA